MNDPTEILDAIVVGGGPAGLSGALLLGRCRRRVALFDEGRPRNEASPAVHAFLGHEGIPPLALLERGREEVASYPNVALYKERVVEIQRSEGSFRVFAQSGSEFRARGLLIATGLIDRLPEVEGMEQYYGHSVHQCPYCDGWESADTALAATGSGDNVAELALELLLWSSDVSLFLNGEPPDHDLLAKLKRRGIRLFFSPPAKLMGTGKKISGVELADGTTVPCKALFLVAAQIQHDDFAEKLGSKLVGESKVDCDGEGRTGTPGLFVAGNVTQGLQLAMVAAAEGLKAAAAINDWLMDIDEAGTEGEQAYQ